MAKTRGGVSEALVLRPECAEIHKRSVETLRAEAILVPEAFMGVYPMEVDIRLRFADGSVSPWTRVCVRQADEKRLLEFDVTKACDIVGYDYIPIFTNRKSMTPKKLLVGDIYTLTWSFNLDI